jgi:hypothetical protein
MQVDGDANAPEGLGKIILSFCFLCSHSWPDPHVGLNLVDISIW